MCPGAESVISEESELLDRAHSPPKTDPSECTGGYSHAQQFHHMCLFLFAREA